MERAADPSPHVFVFLMLWIKPGFEEVGITRSTSNIFGRSGPFTGNAAGIFCAFLARDALHPQQMTPVIAEVVFVEDRQGILIAIVGEVKVEHSDLSGLEGLAVGQSVFIELRRAVDQAADIELMQMTVGPSEGCLQYFVKLSEVECDRQFENTADLGFDVEDMDLGADNKAIRVKRIKHIWIMPPRMITGNG